MRGLLWLLALAALAVALAVAAHHSEGYLLVVVPPWRVELSFNLAILLLFVGFVVGHLALRAIAATLGLPGVVRAYRARRACAQSDSALRDALRLFYEGRYSQVLKRAEAAHAAHQAPAAARGLAALIGLRAAHELRDVERVAQWRARARAFDADLRAARLMTEAELAVEERRFDDAHDALDSLAAQGRHIAALRLALRAAQGQGHWHEVLRLTRQLVKHKALTPEQAAPIRLLAHRANFARLAGDGARLRDYWQTLPQAERLDSHVALEAGRAFAAAGDCAEAARIVEDSLDEQWNSALITAYAECPGGDVLARIAHAEKWLVGQPGDAQLLLALGRLCRQRQLWGKAQSYLEASLAIAPTRFAHLELATLLDSLDKTTEANRHFRAAAAL